jgi:hypothetical protein
VPEVVNVVTAKIAICLPHSAIRWSGVGVVITSPMRPIGATGRASCVNSPRYSKENCKRKRPDRMSIRPAVAYPTLAASAFLAASIMSAISSGRTFLVLNVVACIRGVGGAFLIVQA